MALILHGSKHRGLTLLEVLVVIALVGIGWFTLLPSLDLSTRGAKTGEDIEDVNLLLHEARVLSMREDVIQVLHLGQASAKMIWGEDVAELPASVSRCTVNDVRQTDKLFTFRVYPSGFMDQVQVVLSNGKIIDSNVLGVAFEHHER